MPTFSVAAIRSLSGMQLRQVKRYYLSAGLADERISCLGGFSELAREHHRGLKKSWRADPWRWVLLYLLCVSGSIGLPG